MREKASTLPCGQSASLGDQLILYKSQLTLAVNAVFAGLVLLVSFDCDVGSAIPNVESAIPENKPAIPVAASLDAEKAAVEGDINNKYAG